MERIDLSGIWAMRLEHAAADLPPACYPDEIRLPDSTSHAQKGPRNHDRHPGHLTDPYAFEGCLRVRREVEIPESWAGLAVRLTLERSRKTTLFLDGQEVGSRDSLCTPHRYLLPPLLPGNHRLEIAVENTGYPTPGGHMTSPDTQTNWLGILGEMSLEALPAARIENLRILSGTSPEEVLFSLDATASGELCYAVDAEKPFRIPIEAGAHTLSFRPERPLSRWDEFSPALHTLRISLNGEAQTLSFGIRHLETRGRRLLINGRETFLRGTHEGLVFPKTGYAPMDTDSWLQVLRTTLAYGINHYRFHTCCPPEAAFAAADQLGVYLEPELPFWGTVAEEETAENRYLLEEGFRILREYGNHPSFALFSLGNELWGSRRRLEEMLETYHRADDRHLYTDGSNNFQFTPAILRNTDFLCGVRLSRDRLYRGSYATCDGPQGFVQTDEPNTAHCYDAILTMDEPETGQSGGSVQVQVGTGVREVSAEADGESLRPELPVISHEIGQYYTYPDYREINHYTGVLKAENLALLREKAEKNSLLPWAERFFRASGALAADCYRRELEAALKSEELSGFQLLDLQDYPGQGTALVGMLNALRESKGIISPEAWRHFCAPTVIMAALPRFVFSTEETIRADLLLFRTAPEFRADRAEYCIQCGERILSGGFFPIREDRRVSRLGTIEWKPESFERPAICFLRLRVPGTEVENTYRFTLYPPCDVRILPDGIITEDGTIPIVRDRPEAERLTAAGEKVLLIPERGEQPEGTYCTDFWCYPMFRSISESMHKPVPVGTLGCLINPGHPALRHFPSETFSTPDWYHLITHSHCENLSGSDIEPIVWVIDNPDRAWRLALLYELPVAAGSVLVCSSRLWEIAERPEVRWFARGLTEYLLSGQKSAKPKS